MALLQTDLGEGKAEAESAVQLLAGMDALMMGAVAAMADVADELEKAAELDETNERSFVLVIEATFLARDAAIAREYGHLTATEAAALAARSAVKQLVLTHISGRYPDEDVLVEATGTFPNSRLANDFDRIMI